MFKFIAFIATVLAYLSLVAASRTAVPLPGAGPGPTGFNMCVVSTEISMFPVVDLFLFSTTLGLNGSGCPPGSTNYTLSSQYIHESTSKC